jgi:hypothetical protein
MYNLYIDGYKLTLTCIACPESYDVFDPEGKHVAYMRLRHGTFTVSCPDYGGDIVYDVRPKGDGIFVDDERIAYLHAGIHAMQEWTIEKFMKDVNYDS